MSRSYKHTPVYKGDKDRFAKKLANRRIRRRSKLNPNASQSGKSNYYRKENESRGYMRLSSLGRAYLERRISS